MPAKLYIVHGSHPSAAVAKALELKGVPFKVVELPELAHIPLQRMRFGGRTVPALRFEDGEKVQGSTEILRRLDVRAPKPRLFPEDAERRARVEELERWGAEELQPFTGESIQDEDTVCHAGASMARSAAVVAAAGATLRPALRSRSSIPARHARVSASVTGPKWAMRKILPFSSP